KDALKSMINGGKRTYFVLGMWVSAEDHTGMGEFFPGGETLAQSGCPPLFRITGHEKAVALSTGFARGRARFRRRHKDVSGFALGARDPAPHWVLVMASVLAARPVARFTGDAFFYPTCIVLFPELARDLIGTFCLPRPTRHRVALDTTGVPAGDV